MAQKEKKKSKNKQTLTSFQGICDFYFPGRFNECRSRNEVMSEGISSQCSQFRVHDFIGLLFQLRDFGPLFVFFSVLVFNAKRKTLSKIVYLT